MSTDEIAGILNTPLDRDYLVVIKPFEYFDNGLHPGAGSGVPCCCRGKEKRPILPPSSLQSWYLCAFDVHSFL